MSPTIIAWSSAPVAAREGVCARAVVRISGPATREVLSRVLSGWVAEDAGASVARLTLGAYELACLVVAWRGPRSYTGEDAAELIVPGSECVVRRVVEALLGAGVEGVRLAGAGEFTARAFAAGKLTLEEAEGVAAAIAAGTREELAAARELMDGHAGAAYHELAEELATLAALVEAGIDFTDQEDVVAIAPRDLARRLERAATEIAERLGGSTEHRDGRALVALVGAPNAGKSTLFNAMLGRRRSVESDIAGTTRDVVIEACDLGACTVDLADCAGLDESDASGEDGSTRGAGIIDAAARERALAVARRAQVVLWCDPSGRYDDSTLSDAVGNRAIRVRTRADQWLARHTQGELGELGEVHAVCALDGWGFGVLKERIAREAMGMGGARPASVGRAVVQRHRDVLARVRDAIARASAHIDPAARSLAQGELVASHLHAAIDAIGELTGRIERDEVIGRVFAKFCVGK